MEECNSIVGILFIEVIRVELPIIQSGLDRVHVCSFVKLRLHASYDIFKRFALGFSSDALTIAVGTEASSSITVAMILATPSSLYVASRV